MKNINIYSYFLLVPLLLMGCASVDIQEGGSSVGKTFARPSKIYVKQFTSKSYWDTNLKTEEEIQRYRQTVITQLHRNIISRVGDIASAESASSSLPKEGWLIEGEILSVTRGNRALRFWVGFGAGATQFTTSVKVYDLANPSAPILSFQTAGGTNLDALPTTEQTDTGSATGIDGTLDRTSREIRDYLLKKIR